MAVAVACAGRGVHGVLASTSRGRGDAAGCGRTRLGALGVLAVLLLVDAAVSAARLRRTIAQQRLAADTQRQESDRNQQAILRLLDELSSLADGDLTVQATVTEDITGAIADSINYAVDALRGLVTTINGSAIQLDSRHAPDAGAVAAPGQGERRAVEADRLRHRVGRQHGGAPSRRCRATPSAPPTSRATRWRSRTRAAMRCAAPSTA